MDLGHSPDTGASEGELRSGYALTPSPSHSKNISLFTERRTSERAVSKDGYSSFLFNPLWGFTVVAAGILFVVDHMTDRTVYNTKQNHIGGHSNTTIDGTIYMPGTPLVYNGGSTGNGRYTMLVASELEVGGHAVINSNYSGLPQGESIIRVGVLVE